MDELRKALVAGSSGTGQYLIPEDLEPIIRKNLMVLSPLTAMVPVVSADGHLHKVSRRSANISAWVEGELATPSYSQSTYDQRSVAIKILRTHGKVSDFMQSASRSFVDAVAAEIDSATMGMAELFEYMTIWGVGNTYTGFTGDAYQYDGVYPWFLLDAGTSNALVDVDGVIALSDLDQMISNTKNKYAQLRNDPYIFLASPDMIDKISGLQTRVTRDVQTIEYEGGFVMATYRGIPILPSGFVQPAATTTSPAVTAAADTTTTGHLSDGTYYYQVASITRYGEQIAGTEGNVTLSGGGSTQNVDLSWTADSNALLYAIYRGTTTGTDNLQLIDIIAAKTYDSNGNLSSTVAAYDDTTAATPTYTNVQPMAAGEETIFLVNLGAMNGISRVVLTPELGDPVADLIHYANVPVADDTHAFRLKSYHAIQAPWGASHAVARRAKLA